MFGPSRIGLYQPSVVGHWLPFHTLGVAALWNSTAQPLVSRGNPWSRTSMNWGIWWSASGAAKDGERGRSFPTMRHEHLLGLIGRLISPPRPRRKKERRKGGLNGIAGTPFSRHLQNGKQNHRERLLIIYI